MKVSKTDIEGILHARRSLPFTRIHHGLSVLEIARLMLQWGAMMELKSVS